MKNIKFVKPLNYYSSIPGSNLSYWISDSVLNCFKNKVCSGDSFGDSEGKNVTTNNDKYILFSWEVNKKDIGDFNYKWVPCATGGTIRKWYGNVINVIDWSDKARKFYKDNPSGRIIRKEFWNLPGVTWGKFGTFVANFRFLPTNYMYQETAILQNNIEDTFFILALLNSNCINAFITVLNPTINLQLQDIKSIPIMKESLERKSEIVDIGKKCCSLSKEEWDDFEVSIDFKKHPMV